MQFRGCQVFVAGNKVWLTPYMFDETKPSDVSGFTQAWPNGEAAYDGFVPRVAGALINRTLRREPRFVEVDPSPDDKGEIMHVGTPESLAAFIRRMELEGQAGSQEVPPA
jgi:hypothetical protein